MELKVHYVMLRSAQDKQKFEIYRVVKGQHKPNKMFWGLTFDEAAPIIDALNAKVQTESPTGKQNEN